MTSIKELSPSYNEEDFLELKSRLKPLFQADPSKAQTDACLKRFLRGFQDVDEACKALLKYIKWREDYGVDYLSNDDDVIREVNTGKAVVLDFPDKSHRPIIIVTARLHDARERDLDVITKFIIYTLAIWKFKKLWEEDKINRKLSRTDISLHLNTQECATRKCDESIIDNICILFDLKGFSFYNMDYGFVKQLIWLLTRRFPERLGHCLLLNAPIIFSGCWTIIRLWINEVTASKIVFIKDDNHLSEFIPLDILPQSVTSQ